MKDLIKNLNNMKKLTKQQEIDLNKRVKLDGKVEYNPYDYDKDGNYLGRYFEQYTLNELEKMGFSWDVEFEEQNK
tara:strand:+ start:321 stop:545 length:225 start_codon:yes stop_codon:yes gene_type:complete